ncbi:MAG: DNA primase [Rhizobiales bacterium]|nr:DNA primase [Hyphomicrobiales bacterium]
MRFPPSLLDDIRSRVPISSVVGRKVAWDRRKTNAGKGDYWACCPFHGEKSPSFHVEDRKGRYHCFGCKVSGDIFTFLVEKEGLKFPEAVEQLAMEAGLPMPKLSEEDVAREEARTGLYDIMDMAAAFFEAELQSPRGAKARGYLSDRQLMAPIQKEFRLGYAPDDRSALRSFLANKNVPLDKMIEAGLLVAGDDIPVAYDRFRDRVIFPIRDPRGRVIAFGGRALSKDAPAKYLNSPETPLFSKGKVLYNLDKARAPAHEKSAIIAVEGYVDVIAMHRAGLPHAVAPLGTALTQDQLGMLWRIAPEPVLSFDGDSAGLKAAYRALDLALPMLQPGHSLRFAFMPEGQDPDDLLKAQGTDAVRGVVEQAEPLSEVLWRRALSENDRATPERKAQFERDLRSLINTIGDDVVKKHYLSDMGERLAGLFGKKPGSAWRGANRGQKRPSFVPFSPRYSPKGKPWDIPEPASPQLRALANQPASAADRRERLMVLAFVVHPGLLHDFLDELAAAELASRELDSLRSQILDIAALETALDRDHLKGHLIARGFGNQIARLENQAKRLNEWFLDAGAADDDARTALRQMFALHRKSITLGRELKAAESAFAGEPSEENLNALMVLREELSSMAGAEAQVEGFGQASGRQIDAIT